MPPPKYAFPELNPQNPVIQHDPFLKSRSLKEAHSFYDADSKLSQDERRRLCNAFWGLYTWVPFLGLPLIYVGIKLPTYLQKAKLLDAKKKYRGFQFSAAFISVFAASYVARTIGHQIFATKLSNDPNMQTCWRILGRYPTQLGYRYYTMTSRHPELAMPSPETIDWDRNSLFPMYLIMNRQVMDSMIEQREQRMRRIAGPYQPEEEYSGSSWDKVRKGSNSPSETSAGTEDPFDSFDGGDSCSQLSDEDPYGRMRVAKITNITGDSPIKVGALDQDEFNRVLDQEREGTSGLQDDFTESEKRWS